MALLNLRVPTTKQSGLCPKTSATIEVFTQAIAYAASPNVEMVFGVSRRSSLAHMTDTLAVSAGKNSNEERFSADTSGSTLD